LKKAQQTVNIEKPNNNVSHITQIIADLQLKNKYWKTTSLFSLTVENSPHLQFLQIHPVVK